MAPTKTTIDIREAQSVRGFPGQGHGGMEFKADIRTQDLDSKQIKNMSIAERLAVCAYEYA